MAYVRTVKTASGATAVQIVHGSRRGARDIEHLGSAHDEQAVEALKAVARQRLAGGQGELELGLDAETVGAVGPAPLPIVSSRMALLWEALGAGYERLGFDEAVGGDEVFRQLVLARIIEPTSKQDSQRVLAEVGIDAVSYATVKRLWVPRTPSHHATWTYSCSRPPRRSRRRTRITPPEPGGVPPAGGR